jgi:hypothetical protein
MAINYNCDQCRSKGYYRAIFWEQYNGFPYCEKDVACDCEAGRQWQIWQDRMSHPEYVNPFLTMSDDEIIETLTRASENQRINDSEFYL